MRAHKGIHGLLYMSIQAPTIVRLYNQPSYAKVTILSYSSNAKVICRRGRRPPCVTHDGTWVMLTVLECCSAGLIDLPSFVVVKGAGQYMGWHSEISDPDAVFASSPMGRPMMN